MVHTSLLKLMVEEGCHALLLDLKDHVKTVDGQDEVDGESEEENHKEGFEDREGGGAGYLHLHKLWLRGEIYKRKFHTMGHISTISTIPPNSDI